MAKLSGTLTQIYERLYEHFGPHHWWPGETPFEIIVGAILTQNTNWKNVAGAIDNLKQRNLLTPEKINALPKHQLAEFIRPTGYYRIKADRLKAFIDFLYTQYQGNLKKMFKRELFSLREELLQIKGIGPETADSILLYAGGQPIFVIDAYTRRLCLQHSLITERAKYDDLQRLFMDNLPEDPKLFNEFHALIVRLGKEYCRVQPKCSPCPLLYP